MCPLGGSGMDGERAEATSAGDVEPEPDSKATSLWQSASEKALLHATILRALRFGDQPPPGFQRRVQPAKQGSTLASPANDRSSTASATGTRLQSPRLQSSTSDQPADSGSVRASSATKHRLSTALRAGTQSASRQQAAALLAQQPQAIRCGTCSGATVTKPMPMHWDFSICPPGGNLA